jgi:hypothetical protein
MMHSVAEPADGAVTRGSGLRVPQRAAPARSVAAAEGYFNANVTLTTAVTSLRRVDVS